MEHVFICYSRFDRDLAQKLKIALEKQDVDAWIDIEDLPPASRWRLEIQQAIEGCTTFIYLLSPESTKSEYCKKEFEYAGELKKKTIPILLPTMRDDEIPPQVADIQWLRWEDLGLELSSLQMLLDSIHNDYEWNKFLSDLTVKAKNWERKNKQDSWLLRDKQLQEAILTIEGATDFSKKRLTDLHIEYLSTSKAQEKKRKRNNKIFTGAFVAVMACFVCAVSISVFVYLDRTPIKIEAKGRILEVSNRSGYVFLRQDVGSTISVAYKNPVILRPGDGYTILVGTDADGSMPGFLIAYDVQGQIKWKHSVKYDPYEAPLANFAIRHIIVDHILGNEEYQVVVTAQKKDWYPSSLVLINASGEVLSSYWNPGFIYDVLTVDMDGDKIKELVISSVNNNLGAILINDFTKHPATVYVLSPKTDFSGQAFPPYISDLAYGTEYRNWIAVFEPNVVIGIVISIVQVDGRNLIEIRYNPAGGYIFLDGNGIIRAVGSSDHWYANFGDKTPRDMICFLQSQGDDEWSFTASVNQNEPCNWQNFGE